MKPAPFQYHAPRTLEDALALLARFGAEAKVLAGGQSLVPLLNMRLARPAVVVDVNRVPGLDRIEVRDGALALGALVRQRALEREPAVRALAPLLAEAAPWIGHVQTRVRGTVGGSLAHADPAAELPACAVALDAMLTVASARGRRTVAAREFHVALMTTALRPDELLTEVVLPVPPVPHVGTAFLEFARRHGDFALVGVAAVVGLDAGGVCRVARLVFLGAGDVPRAAGAAAGLLGLRGSEARPDEVALAAAAELDPPSDLHASAGYRRRVGAVLAGRALAAAWDRAEQGRSRPPRGPGGEGRAGSPPRAV